MGTGGFIFVAILALWGLYLVPMLIRERAARLDNRAGERSSGSVRVLHRPAAQRPSRRVVLTVDRPLVSDDLPALPTRDLAEELRREHRRARLGVRLRAAAALLGAVALVAAAVAATAGVAPVWTVAVAGAWLAGVLVSGAVAAGVRRRAAAPTVRVAALPPRAHRVATEVFDDRAGTRAVAPRPEPAVPAAVDAQPPAAQRPEQGQETWTPVEVPGPVYASKPASHRPPALPWSMPAPAETVGTAAEPAADQDAAPDEVAVETSPAAASDRPGGVARTGATEVDLRALEALAEHRSAG